MKKSRGASPTQNSDNKKLKSITGSQITNPIVWYTMHTQAFTNAMQRLTRSPLASFLTILVVGVVLSLPAIFQVIIKNLEVGEHAIEKQSRVSIFLKQNVAQEDIDSLEAELQLFPLITDINYISPAQGLKSFQSKFNLGNSLDALENNPLPGVIEITVNNTGFTQNEIDELRENVQSFDTVDSFNMDILWIKRLSSIALFVKKSAAAISIFLIFAVLVVIGNTIKLLGQDFHDEIAISKLVGATDGYVRRPFLYSGLIYGFCGSTLALFFVNLGFFWVLPQLEEIANLYQNQIKLVSLGFADIASLIATGLLLGLSGAWVAANRLINNLSV